MKEKFVFLILLQIYKLYAALLFVRGISKINVKVDW